MILLLLLLLVTSPGMPMVAQLVSLSTVAAPPQELCPCRMATLSSKVRKALALSPSSRSEHAVTASLWCRCASEPCGR